MLMFVYNQSSKQSLKCKQYNNNMTENIYQENIKEETSLDDGVVNGFALCGNHDIVGQL